MKVKQKPLSFSLHPDNIAYIEAAVMKQKEANHRYSRSMYMDDLITHLRTKGEVKKKVKLKVVEPVPVSLNVDAWDKWIAFRKKAKFKAYKTDATRDKLSTMGDFNDQLKIVQNSIDMQYQGLFALKGNNNGSKNKATNAGVNKKLSAYERAREANSEYRQPNEREVVMGANGGHLGRTMDEGEGRAAIEHVDNSTFIDY